MPSGIAFAELATADPQPVTELLTGLGFRRTGRHPGKPVELWEQGDARILLNHGARTGTRGDATALTALGLEIPDPRAAAHRAESLLAPVLPRRCSAQDVPLDGVAAPDGTELFFCATRRPEHPDWTSDFKTTAHPPQIGSADGNITGVDHACDRDYRGGEFRHCYTATVGRVFFEIVQRTAAYAGYGAANAPVRLAAQRR